MRITCLFGLDFKSLGYNLIHIKSKNTTIRRLDYIKGDVDHDEFWC